MRSPSQEISLQRASSFRERYNREAKTKASKSEHAVIVQSDHDEEKPAEGKAIESPLAIHI